MTEHPVVPPSEVLKEWETNWFEEHENVDVLLVQAAQWGADQELNAACEWFKEFVNPCRLQQYKETRRPKSQTLADKALVALNSIVDGTTATPQKLNHIKTLAAAIHRLTELERTI